MSQNDQHRMMRNKQWADMWAEFTKRGWSTEALWAGEVPGFHPEYEQQPPRLLLSPRMTGMPKGVVIVCAGGGFNYKTFLEAVPTAEFFVKAGLNVAILDYRCKPYTKADCLLDAKRAIRYLRYHAQAFNLDPDHIAIMGYSAGGMLTNMAGALFDYGVSDAQDPVERVSARPDAAIVCYGAMSPALTRSELRYDRQRQQYNAKLDGTINLPFDAPPYYIFQTAGDDPQHGLKLSMALADKGIEFELHVFKEGRHGQALYDGSNGTENIPHTAHWIELALEWLSGYGF